MLASFTMLYREPLTVNGRNIFRHPEFPKSYELKALGILRRSSAQRAAPTPLSVMPGFKTCPFT